MVTQRSLVFVLSLVILTVVTAAPHRVSRSLEPADYIPPSANTNEYLPPQEQPDASHTGEQVLAQEQPSPTKISTETESRNVNQQESNGYLPPEEIPQERSNSLAGAQELPLAVDGTTLPPNDYLPPAADQDNTQSERLSEPSENAAEHEEVTEPALNQLPPQEEAPLTDYGTAAVTIEDGNNHAQAAAEGDEAVASVCASGQCLQSRANTADEPQGYVYPKPEVPFNLPTDQGLARTVEEKLPAQDGQDGFVTCAESPADNEAVNPNEQGEQTSNGNRHVRESNGKLRSLTTNPSDGPIRISTRPFQLTRADRQERAEVDNAGRNRRDVVKQTKPAPKKDQATVQTLPAKVGTARTLPAKVGTAQTLPAKVRRDTKDKLTAQTLPAKVGTAQTLPAKVGTARTLPAKVRRDTKDKLTAQTLPAKVGTAQTLPAKVGTAQTLPAKVRRDTKDKLTAQTLPAKVGTAQTLPAKVGTARTLPAKV